jgi:hypothetical protein
VLALLRFHWAAGARVALRANAVVLGVIVFVFGSAPDGLATLRGFVLGVVAREHGGASRGVLAAIAFAFAGTAVPRVLLGASGWMRSLPVDARASWRAAVAALCVAQLAVATFIPISVSLAVVVYHADLSPAKIVALPVMIVAVAATALPSRRRSHAFDRDGRDRAERRRHVVGTRRFRRVSGPRRRDGPGDYRPAPSERRRRVFATRDISALEFWIRAAWRAMRPQGIRRDRRAPGHHCVVRVLHHGEQPRACALDRGDRGSRLRRDFAGAVRRSVGECAACDATAVAMGAIASVVGTVPRLG